MDQGIGSALTIAVRAAGGGEAHTFVKACRLVILLVHLGRDRAVKADRVLDERLRGAGIDTVIITGGETDVCVLSTTLGAIDWGFRVVLVQDALCSSADETHDAMMDVYMNRFGEQVETVTTQTILDSWQGARRRKIS